ncbi:unnamed protein product [Caenorhabditis brenneri]
MPLPLLKIPYVALRYIANHIGVVELLKISLCSRKADRAMKRCGMRRQSYFNLFYLYRSSFNYLDHLELMLLEAGRAEGGVSTSPRLKLAVQFWDSVRIDVNYDDRYVFSCHVMCLNKLNQFAGIQKSLMIKNTYIPVVLTDDKRMYTFWNNRANGLMFFRKCVVERFSYVTHTLSVHRKITSDASQCLRNFIDYSALPEVSLSYVFIDSTAQMPIEDFRYILEKVKFRDQLVSRCSFSCYFEANEKFNFHSTILCSKLSMHSGHWITLQYLLLCKHKEIRVLGSKFTNEQIKTYINQWVTGTIPDVERIAVGMAESLELKNVLSGLQRCRMSKYLQRDKSSDRLYVFIKGAGDKVTMIEKCRGREGKEFSMKVYSDPDAVDIGEEDEEKDDISDVDEDEEEDEGDDEDEEEDFDENEENEDEEEEESDSDDDVEEGGEKDGNAQEIYEV